MGKANRDIEFEVWNKTFMVYEEASAYAVDVSIARKVWVNINVIASSEAGAGWWAGSDGVKAWKSNPTPRIIHIIKVKAQMEDLIG